MAGDRPRAEAHEEAREFLEALLANEAAITEFTLYSIGIILTRHGRGSEFQLFLQETIHGGGVDRIRLGPEGLDEVAGLADEGELDFDDAYQLVAARRSNLGWSHLPIAASKGPLPESNLDGFRVWDPYGKRRKPLTLVACSRSR